MKTNWNDRAYRVHIIREILGQENRDRKDRSVREVDVYRGKIAGYVRSDLIHQYGKESASEIPLISSVNVARRVVDNDSKLYSHTVKREFKNVSDSQVEALNNIYSDMKLDNQLLRSSRYFNLQQQNINHILPKNGQLINRVYKMHQVDAIPMEMNPEKAQAYIVSNFNRNLFDQLYKNRGNGSNEDIADYDDAILSSMVFAVWDRDFQFMMNGKGEIVSDENESRTPGHLPFVDIFGEKDFTFFVDCGNSLVDFTVQYNTSLSSEAQIVKIQGFAQPFLKGPSSIFSKELKIGPDRLIELPTDNINGSEQVEFGYANPNSDLAGVREHRVQLLQDFLSSREISRDRFEGSANYTSGIERLLSMVKDFERSRELISIYENVEQQIFKSIIEWHNAAIGTDLLDSKYLGGARILDSAELAVEYKKPEMVTTESEKIDIQTKKIDSGLSSRVFELMAQDNIDETEAIEKILKIAKHEELEVGAITEEPNIDASGSQSEV